jgi:HK97 family phage portal protein
MNATSSWYNTERVSQQGSVVLKNWMAGREAERAKSVQASTPISKITTGTEMYDIMTGGMGFGGAGVPVTEQTAMAIGAVYACVGLIGGALAALPFHLYKRLEEGRERYDTDLWWLFNESPWASWTSTAAWQHAVQSIALKGDGFWRIRRVSPYSNSIEGFEPYHPDCVGVMKHGAENVYRLVNLDGTTEVVSQADMLHFHGIGFDGFRSLTPIRAALRPAAGIALAADEYAGAFFKNGARADFALEVPGKLDPEQTKVLRESWAARHGGPSNGHLPAILAGGMKVQQLTMNMEDAQLLLTREFQVEDIARIFGVPPHMIGATSKTTSWGTGIEQMSIAFVRYTLGRYIDSITQEINRKIWPRSRIYFGEFNRDALLDGDSKAQAEFFSKALGGPGTQGWMTINEVRRLKNLKPLQDDFANTVQRAGAAKPTTTQGENNAPDDQAAGA